MENNHTTTQDTVKLAGATEAQPQASTEVRPKRRRFTQAEKVAILDELDACERGSKGLILRQKGLSSSVVFAWRNEMRAGAG